MIQKHDLTIDGAEVAFTEGETRTRSPSEHGDPSPLCATTRAWNLLVRVDCASSKSRACATP